MKLWDKGSSMDEKIERFTVGNDREIDLHIAAYDVLASKAHAAMLSSVGLISEEEYGAIMNELNKLKIEIDEANFIIEPEFEDVHSKIEAHLISALGETGKKIHTARSRNDQVLVALQLFYKYQLVDLHAKTRKLFDTLLRLAETHKGKLLPGYTHLQVAMPSSFGLWFSAYAEVLADDMYSLQAALKTVDQNPLGSAAGYGSSFPIDRQQTTRDLGFSTLKFNVVAAQMGRGKCERALASFLGSLGFTLSKFSMDICLYMSQNFNFISFPDDLTTGSSIMPHKKNPDVFELVRAKSNKMQSLITEMQLLTNNLPSGYHRDFQIMKEPIIKGLLEMGDILDILEHSLQQIQVHEIDSTDERYQYLYTVDAMNELVSEGMSFRDAYREIGKQVEEETFGSAKTRQHTHIGSIDVLALERIAEKFPGLE